MAPQTFPHFNDGNVTISFSKTDEKCVLHSHVLALHSTWFKASLSDRWNSENKSILQNGKNHWEYELWFDKDDDLGRLRCKSNLTESEVKDKQFISGSKDSVAEGRSVKAIALHTRRVKCIVGHQNMFRTLYHTNPVLGKVSLDNASPAMVELASISEYYGCERAVYNAIHNHINVFRAEIEDRCSRNPVTMLELAISLKSDWMFKEAATHLLGRCETAFERATPQLEELEIADLMISKRAEFVSRLEDCEYELFKINFPRGHRTYASNVAISYFRYRLAFQLEDGQGSGLAGGYSQIYRAIQQDQSAPWASHHEGLLDFIYSMGIILPIGMAHAVITTMSDIAGLAAPIIQPIMEDKTRQKERSDNLTFMQIEDEELPWIQE